MSGRLVPCTVVVSHGHYIEDRGCWWCERADRAITQRKLGFTRADVRTWLYSYRTTQLLESDVRWIVNEVYGGKAIYTEEVIGTAGATRGRIYSSVLSVDHVRIAATQTVRRDFCEWLIEQMPEETL